MARVMPYGVLQQSGGWMVGRNRHSASGYRWLDATGIVHQVTDGRTLTGTVYQVTESGTYAGTVHQFIDD